MINLLCDLFISGKMSFFEFRTKFKECFDNMTEEDLRCFASLVYSEWEV